MALISAAVHTFLRTRKDLRRDGDMFGGGLALTTVLDPLKTFRRASYFPRAEKQSRRSSENEGLVASYGDTIREWQLKAERVKHVGNKLNSVLILL